jgi:DNA-binding GntR family transcriptional regulator
MKLDSRLSELAFTPQQIPSLRDQVYDYLRDAILSGRLEPGRHIVERDIAAQMQISTTPVKEALRRLEQDGLVTNRPRRGVHVSDLALTSVSEVVEIRAMLEGMAARLAATKMTSEQRRQLAQQVERMQGLTDTLSEEELFLANSEFHATIRQIGANQMINKFVAEIRSFDLGVRRQALHYPEEVRRGFAEHQQIFQAITDRDGQRAEQLMRAHILRTVQFVIEHAEEIRHG